MPTPLYKTQATPRNTGNAGLWYNKFCHTWNISGNGVWSLTADKHEREASNPKLDWIKSVCRPVGNSALLKETILRRLKVVESLNGAHHHAAGFFKLDSRFVTGLGLNHPVENGFTWHHTLGTPYLPGSSVKGAVRQFALYEVDGCETDGHLDAINRIFGPEPGNKKSPATIRLQKTEDPKRRAGSVIFLDAVPCEPPTLEAEVLTPHYGPYYQDDSGKEPPADWHSPTPIPFLVVQPGAVFHFALLPRLHPEISTDQVMEDLALAWKWLTQTLDLWGAGAKTALGYGRFILDSHSAQTWQERLDSQKQKLEEQQELQQATAGLSPLAAEFITQARNSNWENNPSEFEKPGPIDSWLDRLKESPDPQTLEKIIELMNKHRRGLLKNLDQKKPPKKQKKKKKGKQQASAPEEFKFSNRLRDLARRILALQEKLEKE